MATSDAATGLSFTINDNGLFARMGVAPQITAYFAAKALGSMFGRARKEIIARAPTAGLKRLARRSLFYTGFPKGGSEQLLLKFRDPSVINRIHQRLFSASKWAKTQEFGGTIRAKNGGYLTIHARGAWARSGRPSLRRVREVTIKPQLGVFKTWAALDADRRAKIAKAAGLIAKSLEGRSVDSAVASLLSSAYRRSGRRAELTAPRAVGF